MPKSTELQDGKPRRGDIWRVDLEPTIGSEIRSDKGRRGDTRPILVLSRPRVGEKSVYLCAPITNYKPDRDELRFWRIEISDTPENGLDKMSCNAAPALESCFGDSLNFTNHAPRFYRRNRRRVRQLRSRAQGQSRTASASFFGRSLLPARRRNRG